MSLSSRKIFILAILCWTIQFAWVQFYLEHDFLLPLNDVRNYWYKSESLKDLIGPFHVPLYSFLLYLLRLVSFDILNPMVYMQGINLLSFFASIALLYKILQAHINDSKAALAQLAFIFFPIAGISYVVNPYADSLAIALFLAAIFSLESKRPLQSVILFFLCLLTHKIMWLLVAVYLLVKYISKGMSLRMMIMQMSSFLSIGFYWFLGFSKYHTWDWIVRFNLEKEFSSHGVFYPFKGIVSLLQSREFNEILLGVLVLLLLAAVLYAVLRFYRSNSFITAICIGFLLFLMILNKDELFVLIRYGKLVIPAVLVLCFPATVKKPAAWIAYILIGIGSNLMMANYAFG